MLYWHQHSTQEPTSGDLDVVIEKLQAFHTHNHARDSSEKRRLALVIHTRYGVQQGVHSAVKLAMMERIVTEMKGFLY